MPILVHGDVEVTDESMNSLHPSMARLQMFNQPDVIHPLTLIVQNHVVGCTMLFNRRLLELALPFPREAYMHDWWIAMLAEFVGRRQYLDRPLLRYRQHQSNEVGAKGVRGRLTKPQHLGRWFFKMSRMYRHTWAQGRYLRDRIGERDIALTFGSKEKSELLNRFVGLSSQNGLQRVRGLVWLRVHSQNWLMTGLYYLQALFLKP